MKLRAPPPWLHAWATAASIIVGAHGDHWTAFIIWPLVACQQLHLAITGYIKQHEHATTTPAIEPTLTESSSPATSPAQGGRDDAGDLHGTAAEQGHSQT